MLVRSFDGQKIDGPSPRFQPSWIDSLFFQHGEIPLGRHGAVFFGGSDAGLLYTQERGQFHLRVSLGNKQNTLINFIKICHISLCYVEWLWRYSSQQICWLQLDFFSSYIRNMKEFKISPCPFGEVLVAARRKRGISQPQLAKLMGRTPQQLAKLEHGKNEPVLSTILLIAHILIWLLVNWYMKQQN